jgi:hypothetical protein
MEVRVRAASGAEFAGELMDVSIGGVAARFTLADDPGLAHDDVVDLVVGSPDHDHAVRALARTIHVEQGGPQHWRYGFDFVDAGDLYSQLDAFYARYFNRRRAPRVEVPPEQRITTRLEWSGGRLVCPVFDLSTSGMSTLVAPDKATKLATVGKFYATLRLPGLDAELGGPVRVEHCTPARHQVLVGMGFHRRVPGGFREHERHLAAYVEKRLAELARWESTLGR